MDAFIGRTNYDSFLGKEALHLRAWLPLNIRAYIAAIEYHYQVPTYVKESGDPRLMGVMEGILEAYISERGWMGTHKYKVYGFLEVVAKTGRSETNGNSGASDNAGRPWEEVHKTLSESMKERLEPFRGKTSLQPHELRGSFEECRFKARILSRSSVDNDPSRSTGMITLALEDTGITYQPGDRLVIMPVNSWAEVNKMTAALGLDDFLQTQVPLAAGSDWERFAKHLKAIGRTEGHPSLTVKDILRRGHLSPLTKDFVMALHMALRASSSTVVKVLGSEMWPVQGTVGDLLQLAISEVSPAIWDNAFDLNNLSWLPKLIPIETPRTYSISNYSDELLPSTLDLTVSRNVSTLSKVLHNGSSSTIRYGVSSGCLNPDPLQGEDNLDEEEYLIGVGRPLNFELPVTMSGPIAMFAGGSGIAPFRSFWQARVQNSIGRNILFFGTQSRARLSYEHELRDYVRGGQIELHTAFSRDTNGLTYDPVSRDLVETHMKPRYLDAAIVEQGRTVCDMVISKSQGGLGGHLYICGSLSMYDTIMSGIRQALYQNWASTKETADGLIAKAFAERRFMLDIFMSPKPVSYSTPRIPISKLALNTGHRKGSRMWIGVHGSVYDITDFLPIHPGGTLIAQASGGLDASKTFDDLAHTTNPEVMSLLSKYFIGHLASKPGYRSAEISNLYDLWYQYLRNCVESLTTLFFEVNYIQQDARTWFQGDLFNMGGVRKFYQFQSRLMQNGFTTLFGAKLQELYLKLTFALVNSGMPDTRLSDVIGIITRAQASPEATAAAKEIAQIGQFVCNSHHAQFQENGILRYSQAVTELDVQFLEEIRQDVCLGMDAFDVIENGEVGLSGEKQRLVQLASYLLSILERVAQRLETFYSRLARESIYRPEIEKNPARTRWNLLKRKIRDGSLFILTQDSSFNGTVGSLKKPFRATRHADQDIAFAQVVSQAKQVVNGHHTNKTRHGSTSSNGNRTDSSQRQTLAHSHTARATPGIHAPSSHEIHESRNAVESISRFIESNNQSIKRLSMLPSNLTFSDVMAAGSSAYGPPSPPPSNNVVRGLDMNMNPNSSHRSTSRGYDREYSVDRSSSRSHLVRRRTNTSTATSSSGHGDGAIRAHGDVDSITRSLMQAVARGGAATPTTSMPPTTALPLAPPTEQSHHVLGRRSRSRSQSQSQLQPQSLTRSHSQSRSRSQAGTPPPGVPHLQTRSPRSRAGSEIRGIVPMSEPVPALPTHEIMGIPDVNQPGLLRRQISTTSTSSKTSTMSLSRSSSVSSSSSSNIRRGESVRGRRQQPGSMTAMMIPEMNDGDEIIHDQQHHHHNNHGLRSFRLAQSPPSLSSSRTASTASASASSVAMSAKVHGGGTGTTQQQMMMMGGLNGAETEGVLGMESGSRNRTMSVDKHQRFRIPLLPLDVR